ncbi:heterokaryon incompatibility protein Het-C-domain-containing protein [Cristinia sonorae]|uniref:Heterokaryon incompatibility protein Het-C-domain-containing protein n=1 Tax=Cristinia sonorae TaxID=1940300 RepID=A0A8K0USM0_9AGAR|nr:heterokaryon incompatibility protein Het-C-domain-containing protein [Cristinia sonorae]
MALRFDTRVLLILLCVLLFCLPGNGVYAFGAGNIPNFAFLEGRAFRHGDIEDTLEELVKRAAAGLSIGAIVGKGGSKFGNLDIKRVYFGNWLRDYSQAVDVSTLQKLQIQSILNLVMILGFLAHGYATKEFEVTPDRLGVYLPIEHIDNPRGYPNDAQKYHPKLRGPVDPRELEVDPRTGMKNYIANESGGWQTSKGLVRRTLQECIRLGRKQRAEGLKEDEYESYRLLGQALHTLEDFPAHSNFCELALVSMGYKNVFVHVGDRARIQAPNGQWVAPLVTGTFGSSDFVHSMLGEAADHISQASVVDLNAEITKAKEKSKNDGGSSAILRSLLSKIPTGEGKEIEREMESVERIRDAPSQGGKRPEDMSPQELHAVLWQVLSFRDRVAKKISKIIDAIPGLRSTLDKVSDSISVFVFTTLEPFLRPIMNEATNALMLASGEVINSHDQYEVFNDPTASDPTHSFLSKDHFNLILNEPAGELGKIILIHTVKLVVKAWDDPSINVNHVTEEILECLFHPDFFDKQSRVQLAMLQYMHSWIKGLGSHQHEALRRLTKEVVRVHGNVRLAGQGGPTTNEYSAAENAAHQVQQDLLGRTGLKKQEQGRPHDSSSAATPSYRPPPGAPPSVSSAGYHPSYEPSYSQPSGGGGSGYHMPEPSYQAPLDPFGLQNLMSQVPQYYQPPPGPPPGHHGGGFFGRPTPSTPAPPDPFNLSSLLGQLPGRTNDAGQASHVSGEQFHMPSPGYGGSGASSGSSMPAPSSHGYGQPHMPSPGGKLGQALMDGLNSKDPVGSFLGSFGGKKHKK